MSLSSDVGHSSTVITHELNAANEVDWAYLATELLNQIFDYCMEDEHVSYPPPPHSLPLVLVQVCSRWRAIMVASPDYWSSFSYQPLTRHQQQRSQCCVNAKASHVSQALQFLDRAGSRPLRISTGALGDSLTDVPDYGRFNKQAWPFDAINDVIYPLAGQIQTLRLALDTKELQRFLTLPDRVFNSLRELEIYPNDWASDFPYVVIPTVWQSIPALRRIKLCHSIPVKSDLSMLMLPWHQLTDISFPWELSRPNVEDLVIQAVNLESLEVQVYTEEELPAGAGAGAGVGMDSGFAVTHPQLRTLKFTGLGPDDHFFSAIHLPGLTNLAMLRVRWTRQLSAQRLAALIVRCDALTHLTVQKARTDSQPAAFSFFGADVDNDDVGLAAIAHQRRLQHFSLH